MLIAGLSMLSVTLCLGVYVIVFGALFATVIPFFKSMTPPAYWVSLGGDNILWICSFVWVLIVLTEIFIIVRMWNEASRVTEYDTGW